ncbi:hypothetical protein ABKN59_001014 [Abortiporus biennis]
MAYSSVIFYQRLRYLSSIDFLNFSSYCNVFTNVVYPSATMHRNFRLLFWCKKEQIALYSMQGHALQTVYIVCSKRSVR